MRIEQLTIKNFRTVKDLSISFPGYYSALCGKNDAGKTNVLRAIRTVFGHGENQFDDPDPSPKSDFPRWLTKDSKAASAIEISLTCKVDYLCDEGVHRFMRDYLKIDTQDALTVQFKSFWSFESSASSTIVSVNTKELEKIQAEEVLNKFRSSGVILFHNSAAPPFPFVHDPTFELLGDLSGPERTQLELAKTKLNDTVRKIAKQQQRAISDLLGRLTEKYKVGVSAPEFNPSRVPLAITLGDDSVELEQWGSGTQNRTKILLTLFRARRVGDREATASKVTPIIVIEEPESFLHPSAQAEFGRMLQDIANEFGIQVIVATHSPYMLSTSKPECNILVRRHVEKNRHRETELVDTSGPKWMEPFALALGIDNEVFEPWRATLFRDADAVLLVEGETDLEYFELLRDSQHGANSLTFTGDVIPYGGKDSIKNSFVLKFIRQKHSRCFITFDLDAEPELKEKIESAGFKKNEDYLALGSPSAPSIEGLVPSIVTQAVHSRNTDLMNQLIHGTPQVRKDAKSRYKRILLDEFKRVAEPTDEYYGKFYPVVKCISKRFIATQGASKAARSGR